jgi:hypothetical protein
MKLPLPYSPPNTNHTFVLPYLVPAGSGPS